MKTAWISFPDAAYTQDSACRAARRTLGKAGWQIRQGTKADEEAPNSCQLYFADYDCLPFERLHPGVHERDEGSTSTVVLPQLSCYSIRKSLIRKNYLANSLHLARLKRQSSQQQSSSSNVRRVALSVNGQGLGDDDEEDAIAPKTWVFEATCADDLDELLTDELYDMREELEENQERGSEERKWYILKPAMADRGMGIRLLDSVEALQNIFEEFDEESDDEDDDDDEGEGDRSFGNGTSVVTSQLRHFVIQEYLSRPLLIQPSGLSDKHKFHLRAYVLAQGSLRVFLYDDMLALFAPKPYRRPEDQDADLSSHLTNTCLQEEEASTVHLLSDLVGCPIGGVEGDESRGELTQEMVDTIRRQASSVVAETFQACANAGRIHFQPWPYAWEVFGVDLMVEWQGRGRQTKTWLLEVNAQPDFARTGDRLQSKIDRLFERVLEITLLDGCEEVEGGGVKEGGTKWEAGTSREGMTLCLDMPLSAGGW